MYIAILYNCIYFLYFNKDILNPQTIVFKVPAFRGGIPVFVSKTDRRDDLVKILSLILITIVFDRTWFSKQVQSIITVGVVLLYTAARKIKGMQFVYNLVLKQPFFKIELIC